MAGDAGVGTRAWVDRIAKTVQNNSIVRNPGAEVDVGRRSNDEPWMQSAVLSSADKRQAFHRLHEDEAGCFVIPNPWDIGSARMRSAWALRSSSVSAYAVHRARSDVSDPVSLLSTNTSRSELDLSSPALRPNDFFAPSVECAWCFVEY